jgi:hypothetical protein
MPTQGGAAAAAGHRHGLEVEDEGHLKDFVILFILLRCFVLFDFSFNSRILLRKPYLTYVLAKALHMHPAENRTCVLPSHP